MKTSLAVKAPSPPPKTPKKSFEETLWDTANKLRGSMITTGRYVGAAPLEDDGIPFETKMTELSQTLYAQMAESAKLDETIRANLVGLGFGEPAGDALNG